jgi:hypothetical protein
MRWSLTTTEKPELKLYVQEDLDDNLHHAIRFLLILLIDAAQLLRLKSRTVWVAMVVTPWPKREAKQTKEPNGLDRFPRYKWKKSFVKYIAWLSAWTIRVTFSSRQQEMKPTATINSFYWSNGRRGRYEPTVPRITKSVGDSDESDSCCIRLITSALF